MLDSKLQKEKKSRKKRILQPALLSITARAFADCGELAGLWTSIHFDSQGEFDDDCNKVIQISDFLRTLNFINFGVVLAWERDSISGKVEVKCKLLILFVSYYIG